MTILIMNAVMMMKRQTDIQTEQALVTTPLFSLSIPSHQQISTFLDMEKGLDSCNLTLVTYMPNAPKAFLAKSEATSELAYCQFQLSRFTKNVGQN